MARLFESMIGASLNVVIAGTCELAAPACCSRWSIFEVTGGARPCSTSSVGAEGLGAGLALVARILFYIFIVLFVVLLVLGLTAFRIVRGP